MNHSRYVIVFMFTAIGTAALIRLLNWTLESGLGSSVQILVPAMIAALIEGRQFARANKRKSTEKEIWKFTLITSVLAMSLNVTLAYLGEWAAPEFARLTIPEPFSTQFNFLLVAYAFGYLICNRFFLALGIRNQLSLMRSRGEIED